MACDKMCIRIKYVMFLKISSISNEDVYLIE